MIVRALDQNHDWTFGKGKNDYLKDAAAISQNIDTRLNCFLADCFFDVSAGVDWFNLLGGKDQTKFLLNINSVILNTEGVTAIVDTSVSVDSARRISVSYSVNTIYTVTVKNNLVISI